VKVEHVKLNGVLAGIQRGDVPRGDIYVKTKGMASSWPKRDAQKQQVNFANIGNAKQSACRGTTGTFKQGKKGSLQNRCLS